MNNQIRELAEQAGFVLWNDEDWKPESQVIDWSSVYDKELEKFAELIVKECAELADEPTSRPYESYGEKIKKHFGVE